MSIPLETHRLTRFIHEGFHNIAEKLKIDVDLVSEVVEEWQKFKEEYLHVVCPKCGAKNKDFYKPKEVDNAQAQ